MPQVQPAGPDAAMHDDALAVPAVDADTVMQEDFPNSMEDAAPLRPQQPPSLPPPLPQLVLRGKRSAGESATVLDDMMEAQSTPGAASSSAMPPPAPVGIKRAADLTSEALWRQSPAGITRAKELDDMPDIMSVHVGPAFALGPQGSIAEIYSPPRIVPHAERKGFAPGWSLDLTTTDESGMPWDFSRHECREKARRMIRETRPLLLVGSPMCTWFSIIQNLNRGKVDPVVWEKGYKQAVEHLKFVFELYDMQVRGGRYFLHEHPASATSWKLEAPHSGRLL